MNESLGIFLQNKYPNIPNTEKAAIYHYTKGEGATFRQLNNQLRKGNLSEFNESFSKLLSQGLSKLPTIEKQVYRTIRLNKKNLNKFKELTKKPRFIFNKLCKTNKYNRGRDKIRRYSMQKLLVVVDMQNDFIGGALGTKEAVSIVDNVVAEIKKYPVENIMATRDTHEENYMDTREGRHLPVPHCIRRPSEVR